MFAKEDQRVLAVPQDPKAEKAKEGPRDHKVTQAAQDKRALRAPTVPQGPKAHKGLRATLAQMVDRDLTVLLVLTVFMVLTGVTVLTALVFLMPTLISMVT